MPHVRTVTASLLVYSLLTACAARTRESRVEQSAAPRFEIIEAGELAKTTAPNLDEAIRELRPSFLHAAAPGEPPTVFVNGFMAAPGVLEQIPVGEVVSVRLLRGVEATQKYGPVHHGAILDVTLRKRLPR